MTISRRIAQAGAIALMPMFVGTVHANDAADARIRELEKKLERSMEMINQLSAKINQIEKSNVGASDAQSKTSQQAAKVEQLEKHVAEIGDSLSRRSADTGLPIHGFADVGLFRSNEDKTNALGIQGRRGFNVGTFSLYMAPQFSDRVKALVELAFEVNREGNVDTDLERVQMGYTFSDAATFWLGRYHTPFGYWNTAFHHGAQIQTSISRPRFLDFEDKGGILPAHTTGAWLTGKFNLEAARLNYDLIVGNSPQLQVDTAKTQLSGLAGAGNFPAAVVAGTYAGAGTLNMRMGGGTTHYPMSGFNASIEPNAVEGLRLGLHGLRAGVRDNSNDSNLTRVRMLGGYGVYLNNDWEVLGEYYRFRNIDGALVSHTSNAGYLQAGYNIGLWTPYARVERTKLDQTDNYFAVQESGRSYKRGTIGLRYDVDPKAALKVELASTRKELGPALTDSFSEARMQYSIRF